MLPKRGEAARAPTGELEIHGLGLLAAQAAGPPGEHREQNGEVMKRLYLAIVMLLLMSLVVGSIACGGDNDDASGDNGESAEVMTTADGVQFVRTPDTRLQNLPDFPSGLSRPESGTAPCRPAGAFHALPAVS